ncbi:hypothetical protein [Zobellia nedashkovskayae]|uniref:hypothetical protein n=1 Tax=Zobellia nedashkovskayae TaxID=2779510 RepID=UPI00188A3909|nr:hypothetical protein [Zobellia nedashkovskayae]
MNIENFKEKYWKDPVWSKVISFAIIGVGTFIFTTIYIWIKSLYDEVPFKEISIKVFEYLKSTTEINTFLFWIILTILGIFSTSFIYSLYIRFKKPKKELEIEEDKELPRTGMNSTALFSSKLAGAFSGQRGFKWYESSEAIMRLEKFFEPPLKYEPIGEEAVSTPIWWFRAGSSMYIDEFKKLSKTKLLIGIREFKIKRIGVFVSNSYYKSFIYVETSGEKQTGVYKITKEDIKRDINTFGYSSEEYAIFKNKIKLTREEYDDASKVIKGKVVDTFGSELRVRFLSDYNFLITANQSPFNSRKFDIESHDSMNKILKGEMKADDFIESLKKYEKKDTYT